MAIIQGTSKSSAATYEIDQSIRFNDNDSAYLSRAMGTGGNTKTGTISLWVKRATLGTTQILFQQHVPQSISGKNSDITFNSDNTIQFYLQETAGAGYALNKKSSNLYRDVGSWYHIYATWDTTQSSPEWNLYVNGVQPTWATNSNNGMSQNADIAFFGNSNMEFGRHSTQAISYIDAYLAEINCIEGSVVAISEFAETNADTGQWVPKKYTGSYPGKSFYITGEDSADLGADYSGNSNDFTSSGLTSADQVLDTPTDNFCTLNPVDKATQVTLADGNLQYGLSSNAYTAVRGTFGVSSGKWYWEMTAVSGMGVNTVYMGIATNASALQRSSAPTDGTAYVYISYTGNKSYTSNTSYGATWNTNGRVIGVALDLDAGKIWWSRDGVWQASGDPAAGTNEAFSGITGTWHPYVVFNDFSPNFLFNFGQSAFTYTPPTGFKALSTANLPDPTIADPAVHFNTVLYEGNGGGQRVGQFQPITESYTVDNSCMFDDASPDWLNRTNGTPDDNDVWTLSFWVKFADWGGDFILQGYTDGNNNEGVSLNGAGGTLAYKFQIGGVDYGRFESAETFKDPSRWYHIHITRNAGTYTFKADGVDLTDTDSGGSTATTQNAFFNTSSTALYIGAANGGVASTGLNGYLAEMHFIDGSVVAYSDFGQLDASTNRWIPKEYTAGWGSNGWYLDFSNSSSLGADSSGNGNNFSVNNIVAANQVDDSPTKNFATLSSLIGSASVALSDGNLVNGTGNGHLHRFGTIPITEKIYFEVKNTDSTSSIQFQHGLCTTDQVSTFGASGTPSSKSYLWYHSGTDIPTAGSGVHHNGTTNTAYTGNETPTANTVYAYAVDPAAGKWWVGKVSGGTITWYNSGNPATGVNPAHSNLPSSVVPFVDVDNNHGSASWNFGQKGFAASTLPDGFVALNNDNLPLTGGGLSSFVWIKNRDAADNHMLFDAVRGPTKDIHSSSTAAEATNANTLTRFLKNGFEVSNDAEVNTSGESYVAWQWLNNSLSTSSNTDGSITSTVLANTTAGFSIVSYTGNATIGATIGHGLGAAPNLIFIKNRTDVQEWGVYSSIIGPTKWLKLNASDAATVNSSPFNNTAPTSSVFTVDGSGGYNAVNGSGDSYVAYCFSEVEGFSKFGKYTGNGSSDGPFVYCGFRPAFVMIKRTDSAGFWRMIDSQRDSYNVADAMLDANQTAAEYTEANAEDFLSNGFKIRTSASGALNASGGTFIVMAFAESPFRYATAR